MSGIVAGANHVGWRRDMPGFDLGQRIFAQALAGQVLVTADIGKVGNTLPFGSAIGDIEGNDRDPLLDRLAQRAFEGV